MCTVTSSVLGWSLLLVFVLLHDLPPHLPPSSLLPPPPPELPPSSQHCSIIGSPRELGWRRKRRRRQRTRRTRRKEENRLPESLFPLLAAIGIRRRTRELHPVRELEEVRREGRGGEGRRHARRRRFPSTSNLDLSLKNTHKSSFCTRPRTLHRKRKRGEKRERKLIRNTHGKHTYTHTHTQHKVEY